jgi:hypothetical protein
LLKFSTGSVNTSSPSYNSSSYFLSFPFFALILVFLHHLDVVVVCCRRDLHLVIAAVILAIPVTNYDDTKTGVHSRSREQHGGYLLTGHAVSGAEEA